MESLAEDEEEAPQAGVDSVLTVTSQMVEEHAQAREALKQKRFRGVVQTGKSGAKKGEGGATKLHH